VEAVPLVAREVKEAALAAYERFAPEFGGR